MDEKRPAGRLCLDDYKDVLRGEICNLIGHNPDDDELATMEAYAADYVADQINVGKMPDLAGVVSALLECKQEQFIQCA